MLYHDLKTLFVLSRTYTSAIKVFLNNSFTDVNKTYLELGQLNVEMLSRGTAWLDTGTFNSLLDAANYIRVLEERQGLKIACIEEIAYQRGYINAEQVHSLAVPLAKSGYGEYLFRMFKQ